MKYSSTDAGGRNQQLVGHNPKVAVHLARNYTLNTCTGVFFKALIQRLFIILSFFASCKYPCNTL